MKLLFDIQKSLKLKKIPGTVKFFSFYTLAPLEYPYELRHEVKAANGSLEILFTHCKINCENERIWPHLPPCMKSIRKDLIKYWP